MNSSRAIYLYLVRGLLRGLSHAVYIFKTPIGHELPLVGQNYQNWCEECPTNTDLLDAIHTYFVALTGVFSESTVTRQESLCV